MKDALKNILKVKESTIKTYLYNIKRLSKIAGYDSIPENKGWLNAEKGKELIKKVGNLPLKQNRHLFVAGTIAFRAYTQDKERSSPWTIKMNESSNQYSDQRNKQQKSVSESSQWPKEGFRSLRKAASIIKRKISGLLKKKEYTHEEAYEVQKYIILLLMSHHTFRLTPSTLQLKASTTENTLLRPRGSRKWIVTLRRHKTDRSMGELKIPLSLAVSKVLSTYIPKLKRDHFLALRNGKPMSKTSLSKLILRLTKSILGSKIGVRLARVLKVTSKKAEIEKAEALLTELGHSKRTQKTYIRKD